MTTQTLDSVLLQTDFPDLELFASGKVRDVYQVGSDRLLFIATDRISAFDYVLATGIPHKGAVLTQLSLFWFDFLKDVVPNHLATANANEYPAEVLPNLERARQDMEKLFAQNEQGVDVLRVLGVQRILLRVTDAYLDARFEVSQARADLAAAVGDLNLAAGPCPTPPSHP